MPRSSNFSLGDTLELPTPTGMLRLPIVGTIRDLSNQMGAIFIERSVYIRYFQDDTVDVFRVYLTPGASQEEVRSQIVDRLGNQRRMFVMLNREIRAYIAKVTDQWFGLTYIQVIVAMLVAILGIVNTLTVSISDRRRELGVLRAVGGLRNQIRGTIWMEALPSASSASMLGIATGAIMLYYELQAIQHDISGMPFAYQFPLGHRRDAGAGDPAGRRSARPSCPPRARCAARWWRRWNMSKAIITVCSPCVLSPLIAQDARQIVEESQRRGRSNSAALRRRARSHRRGFQSHRKSWQSWRLGAYGNSKAVIRFTAPAEVKGVALLVVNHPDRSSDQWMWTPAIGRDRRIALQDRSTRFFGTDFSFEDLEERDVDQYDYRLTGEETIDGAPCWRIESRARSRAKPASTRSPASGSARTTTFPRSTRTSSKISSCAASSKRTFKTSRASGPPRTLEMTDLRRKSRTVLRLEKLEYNVPLKDDEFTVQALRRDQ